MNAIGDTIRSIIGFQEFYYPETDATFTYMLEIVDLPISPYYILFENAPYYYAEGVLVEQHVLSFSIIDYR